MGWLAFLTLVIWLLSNLSLFAETTSTILTFSDSACKAFAESLEARDGFPDGQCTNFKTQAISSYSSLMINTVDLGCSGT